MPTAVPWVVFESDADRFLPEGPRAIRLQNRDAVAWVNIQTAADAVRGAVHCRFWDTGERRRWMTPSRPGFLLPTDAPDAVLLGMEKAIGTLNLSTGLWTPLAKLPDHQPRTIINDGELVPGGRAVVFGTKDVTFTEPIGHLYLFTLDDHRVTVLAESQTCSNGKVFSADGRTLWDIDTPRKVVTRYPLDVARRTLGPGTVAVDLRGESAFPDGMCDVGDGSVIVAFYDPERGGEGTVRRYRLETGEEVMRWTVPGSPRVTCPLLVARPTGVQLILTTAMETTRDRMPPDTPNAGHLFLADTDLKAVPEPEVVRL